MFWHFEKSLWTAGDGAKITGSRVLCGLGAIAEISRDIADLKNNRGTIKHRIN